MAEYGSGIYQGVKAERLGSEANDIAVFDSYVGAIGNRAGSVEARRCKAEEIACGADSAKIIDSHALKVSPFDSVQAYNSEIPYLGLDTDYIHAVGVDSEVIGHKAEHVAVADVNATIVGYQTRGSVIAANTDAEEIGDETNGAVYVSDGDMDRFTEPQPYFGNQTKMQSPIKQYST